MSEELKKSRDEKGGYTDDADRGAFHMWNLMCAGRPAADESANTVEDRLRRLMGTVNAYEKATGVGGWYAENIQEQCNGLLKALGSAVRFGLGSENPMEPEPAPVASKEAVTLSEATIQEIVRVRGRQDGSLYKFDAPGISLLINDVAIVLQAQRDASKACAVDDKEGRDARNV